jgi:hypothetical protein
MKKVIAYAIVAKNKPKIDLLDIYDSKTIKEVRIGKDEKIIKVIIQEL